MNFSALDRIGRLILKRIYYSIGGGFVVTDTELEAMQAATRARRISAFLLMAAAIGGIVKHNAAISGAEVGCQGETGSAAAMVAAGRAAMARGSPEQIESAAENALEHDLGTTCDPLAGLVQVPCMERDELGRLRQ